MTDAFMQAEAARRQANGQLYGVVASVDYDVKRAVVEIEDGWNTAPLPWQERRAGKARTSSPPSVGEQVTVLSPGGETAAGLILLGVPSDAFSPSEVREGLELFETDGGYSDRWDEEAKTRTIDLPQGGELAVTIRSSCPCSPSQAARDSKVSSALKAVRALADWALVAASAATPPTWGATPSGAAAAAAAAG